MFTSHHLCQDVSVHCLSVFVGFAIRPRVWYCDEWETDTFGSVDHCLLWQGVSDGERVSAAESLPRHSGLFKLGLFLNRRIGEARDGTRDDNIVFFTLRETLQWYMPRWDPANENEQDYQQLSTGWMWEHNVNAYVTVCVSEYECVFMTVPAWVSVHPWDNATMFLPSPCDDVCEVLCIYSTL